MLCGELQCMEVTLKNIGNAPLKNIHLGSTNPKLFALTDQKENFKKGNNIHNSRIYLLFSYINNLVDIFCRINKKE